MKPVSNKLGCTTSSVPRASLNIEKVAEEL